MIRQPFSGRLPIGCAQRPCSEVAPVDALGFDPDASFSSTPAPSSVVLNSDWMRLALKDLQSSSEARHLELVWFSRERRAILGREQSPGTRHGTSLAAITVAVRWLHKAAHGLLPYTVRTSAAEALARISPGSDSASSSAKMTIFSIYGILKI